MLISLSVEEILLLRYVNWSTNFRGSSLKMEMAPFCLKHILCFICVQRGQSFLLLALGYAVGILIGLRYLQEVLGHLHIAFFFFF